MTATQDLLIPDVGLVPKKTRPRPHGLRGDVKLHYEIVLAAEAKGYRLRDLYYLAQRVGGKFSYEGLDDEQLGKILAVVKSSDPPALKIIETELCTCGYSPRVDTAHVYDCTYRKLIRATGD